MENLTSLWVEGGGSFLEQGTPELSSGMRGGFNGRRRDDGGEASVKSRRLETLCCVPGNANSHLWQGCKVPEGKWQDKAGEGGRGQILKSFAWQVKTFQLFSRQRGDF